MFTDMTLPTTTQSPARARPEAIGPQRDSTQPLAQSAGPHGEANEHVTEILSLLPDREISVFDGDAVQSRIFIKGFEQCVDRNITTRGPT